MKKYDFSGYATKHGLKCSDGRTILKDAFKHQDGAKVPLVWQHLSGDPNNILGHAVLENRDGDVYCYGKFNETEAGQQAKALVEHGDISSLSILANQLKEKSKHVMHGMIREVSLVLAGANPGAVIDNLSFAHTDGSLVTDETEAVIYSGLELMHANKKKDSDSSDTADGSDGDEGDVESERTIGEIFKTFSEKEKNVVYALVAEAVKSGSISGDVVKVEHSSEGVDEETIEEIFNGMSKEKKDTVYAIIGAAIENAEDSEEEEEAQHSYYLEGDNIMKHNVFDQSMTKENVLSHDQLNDIVMDAKRFGSLKEAFIAHAEDYGFDPIDVLFPDARYTNQNGPETYKRDDTWVGTLLKEATHTPFSRIKTIVADITEDEARAKGYVTGSLKKDEVIPLLKRVTTPTTIYKKQKLDRDDMIDITDFDVVVWLKNEMRGMLDEELARAILLGDGRNPSDEDKINEGNIRPIALDNGDMYVHRVALENDIKVDEIIDEFIRSRKYYKGSGSPTLYTSTDLLTEMLLVKDSMGRRLYSNITELANVLRVSKIVEVELMNGAQRKTGDDEYNDILGIVVNMKDYTIGADKGGQVALFDDFDIDYNQYKYLIETRVSGALTKPKSALIIERKPEEDLG